MTIKKKCHEENDGTEWVMVGCIGYKQLWYNPSYIDHFMGKRDRDND